MEWDETIFGPLPAELKDSPLLKEAANAAAILKQAIDFQRMAGNSIRIPGDGAGEDVIKEFRDKAARAGLVPKDKFTDFVKPEKPENYTLTDAPVDAEKIGVTQTILDKWKTDAHSLGLSPGQFNTWATNMIAQQREAVLARAKRFGDADEALKKEWGPEAFASRKELAMQAAKKFGGEELLARLGDNPDPAVLRALAAVGKSFVEAGNDLAPRPSFSETRDEATMKLHEIKTNPAHPFNRQRSEVGAKVHDTALAEVVRLTAISLGQKPGKDFMFDEVG